MTTTRIDKRACYRLADVVKGCPIEWDYRFSPKDAKAELERRTQEEERGSIKFRNAVEALASVYRWERDKREEKRNETLKRKTN